MKVEQRCSTCGILLLRDSPNKHPVCFDCKKIRRLYYSRTHPYKPKKKKKAIHRLHTVKELTVNTSSDIVAI